MHDTGSGLDPNSLSVVADFAIDGVAACEELATKFKKLSDSRWEWQLGQPIADLQSGTLTVSVRDRQGNVTRIERKFSVDRSMK
jgi:hypothetical protein